MKYDIDMPKLYESVARDYRTLQPFRENLREHASQAAGSHYSDTPAYHGMSVPANPENPVNMLSLYDRIMIGHLIGGDPRMMASTFDPSLRQYMATMEDWANRKFVEMGLADIFRKAVKHALYLMAWAKVSIVAPAEDRFGGYHKKTGRVGVSIIDFEDMVYDTRAKSFQECWYIGHRYVANYDVVSKAKMMNAKARKLLQPKHDEATNPGGDDRIATIGRKIINEDNYIPYVELFELYLREQNIVVTFDADGDCTEPLMVQEWVGPRCGPYYQLFYGDVIGNLTPKSPVMDLVDTNHSLNTLWKKCDNQASEAKRVCAYRDIEDVAKIEKVQDGGYVSLKNPKEIGEVVIHSGPDQQTALWATGTRDLFSRMAGNLDALGGLGSQADTLGQEKLVSESASKLVQSMGVRTNQFAQDIMRAVCWFWWKNPREEMTASYAAPTAPEYSITRRITPMERFGKPFEEMDIRLDPYSLVSQTPQSRLMVLEKMMKEVFIPTLPLFGQPGVGELIALYVRKVAKYTNNPDLIELLEKITGVQGPAEQQASNPQDPGPADTTRTYERISRPGMTDQGQQQVLQQLMAGGQPGGQGAQGLGQMTRAG